MTTSSSIPSSNVCASTLNIKRQSIGSRRRSSSASSSARKSIVRDNLNRLYRFIVGGTANLRKNRFRQPTDCEIFDNDANIMALSCTAADEEIVPLSPNRAERIVCKNSLGVDHSTHPAHNEYLEQRAELLKGTYTAHTSHLLQPSTPPPPPLHLHTNHLFLFCHFIFPCLLIFLIGLPMTVLLMIYDTIVLFSILLFAPTLNSLLELNFHP